MVTEKDNSESLWFLNKKNAHQISVFRSLFPQKQVREENKSIRRILETHANDMEKERGEASERTVFYQP